MIKNGTCHQAYMINGIGLVEMNEIYVDPNSMTADKHVMSQHEYLT
jgi:hypothetical protein